MSLVPEIYVSRHWYVPNAELPETKTILILHVTVRPGKQ